jgi:hypothetical protein
MAEECSMPIYMLLVSSCRPRSRFCEQLSKSYSAVLRLPSLEVMSSAGKESACIVKRDTNLYRSSINLQPNPYAQSALIMTIPVYTPSQSKHSKPLLPRSTFCFPLHRSGLLFLPPSAPASKSNNNHSKEEQHERNAKTPHCGPEVRMAAGSGMINAVSQNPKRAEISRHDYQA